MIPHGLPVQAGKNCPLPGPPSHSFRFRSPHPIQTDPHASRSRPGSVHRPSRHIPRHSENSVFTLSKRRPFPASASRNAFRVAAFGTCALPQVSLKIPSIRAQNDRRDPNPHRPQSPPIPTRGTRSLKRSGTQRQDREESEQGAKREALRPLSRTDGTSPGDGAGPSRWCPSRAARRRPARAPPRSRESDRCRC